MRKLLVSAYACEPFKGSEQAVGWNLVLQLARNNHVTVITRANNKDVIEPNIPHHLRANIKFLYHDAPSLFLKLKSKEKGVYFYYIIWQLFQIPLLKRLTKKYKFDYSLHLTFGSIWLPTFLPFFKPRFIWGPLGGGEGIPNSFISTLSLRGKLLQYFRNILSFTIYVNPLLLYTLYRASILLYRTENTKNILPLYFQKKCKLLTDGAIEPEILSYKTINSTDTDVLELITTSRLIHTKNITTIIKAIALIPKELKIHLNIIGSGPEKEKLQKLIDKLNLTNRIQLVGRVSRNEILYFLSQSDIYLFASLKEACNLSLLEAMAVGLPVICLNWSGMAISTDDRCAIRLPVTDPEQMPKDMAEAIIKLAKNPELRKQMGENGRKRIQTVFNWEAKGKFMEELFAELDNHEN